MGRHIQRLVITILFLTLFVGFARAQCPIIPSYKYYFDCGLFGAVKFVNTSTAPWGGIDSLDWDFDDGTPHTSNPTPWHVFGAVGA